MPDDAQPLNLAPTPGHVPPERIIDFDIYGLNSQNGESADFALRMKDLHRKSPDVFWTPQQEGHWVVTRADLVERVYTDNEHFSSRYVTVPKSNNLDPPLFPIQADPPEWGKYRIFFNKHLSTKSISSLESDVRELAIKLIEGFKGKGECEYIHDFALHLPIVIFMRVADLPLEDREMLLGHVGTVMRSDNLEGRIAARGHLAAYALQKVQERRGKPGDDAITDMTNSLVDGEPISDYTLVGMVLLMLLAGLDTVTSMLGFSMRHLALHPEHRAILLAHPEKIPDAVEELLRRYAIVTSSRLVKADIELDGVTLRAGDMVCAPTTLHALDEQRYPNAETVDFDRKARHATFGGGNHRCPGSALARTELRVAIEEWLKRIPDFEIGAHGDVIMESKAVATLFALPLSWPPRS
jgi:cytochrome P450